MILEMQDIDFAQIKSLLLKFRLNSAQISLKSNHFRPNFASTLPKLRLNFAQQNFSKLLHNHYLIYKPCIAIERLQLYSKNTAILTIFKKELKTLLFKLEH